MEIHGPMLGTQYPPGFRFHPTDQELIIHYLRKKATSTLPPASSIFAEIDLYKFNPWELPEKALFGEGEWFFFSPRDRKYPNGVRPNRAAGSGYWKATGTDKPILAVGGSQCLGVKKALVFYKGRPPKGIKTDWVMHEYRLLDCVAPSQSQKQKGSMRLDDWVLCRVRLRGSLPPENNETAEIWSAMPAAFSRANQYCNEKQQLPVQLDVKERSNLSELSSCHMSYLQQGNSEEAESAREVSDLASNCREQMVSSMLGSVKRKFCLGSLDDLLLLQQSNRSQFSPADSDSDDQSFLEFLV